MTSANNIKRAIKKLTVDSGADIHSRVLDKLLTTLDKSKQTSSTPTQPNIGRIIMKSKITKLAAAAVIVLIAVLSITFLDKAVTPAWAIEDTIKALENIYAIKMSGHICSINEQSETIDSNFLLWAKQDENGMGSKELRLEIPGQQTTVVSPSGTIFRYYPLRNTVEVSDYTEIRPKIDPWMGSKFFQDLQGFAQNWQVSYGKDEETGKDSIFVTCFYTPKLKSWWFQFDAETKLPVKFKQWININFEGKPEFYAENIEYNPELPEGIFEFEIPEGAKVVNSSDAQK